ncbi:patatin-like phospholipase family protein [Shewanella aestuarii]|uniref:Patatin n=1 Tax=Shewanella aestuarii TaxID=1028752 RepID=A0A6G9QFN4_9GAMM|nr:patatin-like phospholipase family protein [Shewanella aestuarii]QIR13344.1 patatin [Shewanella aestuarii]
MLSFVQTKLGNKLISRLLTWGLFIVPIAAVANADVVSSLAKDASENPNVERPTIGLVLSGGGAKGAAHIGVLQVLEANNIPVDYIAGTSIGAYVAGMYALGFSANEIETIMLEGDWDKGYSDTIPRENLSYRDKQLRDKYNIPIDVGFKNREITAPSGLLQGQTMSHLLRHSTDLVEQFGDFDDLAIPFRAVSTDLATSEPVILSKGSIVQAMQASATVPGALQPALIDGKLLVDGGIANNMPVDVVKAMGADIIIAVDIGSPLVGQNQLNSTIAVLEQLSTMLTAASTERQKLLLNERDILIRPWIDNLSTTDFSIMPQALVIGEQAAQLKYEKLAKLSISDEAYQNYVRAKMQKRTAWVDPIKQPIYQVVLNNQSAINDKLITDRLGIKKGQVVSKEDLEAALQRVYSLNKFERVDAEFTDSEDGRILTVTSKAKSWGPNYFNAGFNWEDDLSLDSAVSLNLAYTMTNLTDNGGEWHNELEMGIQKRIATEFYQPLDRDQDFYNLSRLEYEINKWDIFDQNERVFELKKHVATLATGLGYNLSANGIFELGFITERGKLANEVALSSDFDYTTYGGYVKLAYDSLNSISFPTEGNRFTVTWFMRDEKYHGADIVDTHDKTWQIEADWKGALRIGNHAFVGKVAASTVESDGDFTIHFSSLGGFLNLSGYHKNALAGPHKLFGAGIYQYDLGRDMLITDVPLYVGISLEAGNVWYERDDVDLDDLIYASSIYLGTDTSWGPAALGFGFTDLGDKSVYLFIGKNF